MAKIPKGASVEVEPEAPARQPLPPDAAVELEQPVAPAEPSRLEQLASYIKNTPGRIAETATSINTVPSFVMGATLNAFPRLSAAVETAPAVLRKLAGNSEDIGQTYDDALRRIQPLYTEAAKKEPVMNVVGAVATPNPFSKLTLPGRLAGAALTNGAQNYFGANPDDSQAQRKSGEVGALSGTLVQGGAELLPPVFRGAAKMYRNAAGERAVQAVGARAGITDRLAKMGILPEDVPDLGNRFLDEGLVPSGLNPLKNPLEQTKKAAEALKQTSGNQIGDILKQADAPIPVGQGETAGLLRAERFNYPAAQKAAAAPLSGISASAERAAGKARNFVEDVGAQGGITPGSFQGANQLKSDAYRNVNWLSEAPMAEELNRKSVSGLRGDIERQVGATLGDDARTSLKDANSRYGLGADAAALSGRALSRDVQKQQFSLPRTMIAAAGGAGLGSFGGPGGAGAGSLIAPMVTNAIATRGPNVAAHADRLASRGFGYAAENVNRSPVKAGQLGSLLDDYLKPKDDEQRQEDGAAAFTKGTGR